MAARFAVVGAGVSGLTCAARLQAAGIKVTVYEKSRGPSGRLATKRVTKDGVDMHFDHGAQYFTARSDEFKRFVQEMRDKDKVAPWKGVIKVYDGPKLGGTKDQTTERFVGVPRNSVIGRHLESKLTPGSLHFSTRVGDIKKIADENKWQVVAEDNSLLGAFDGVIISAPAPQTVALLNELPKLRDVIASQVKIKPCWAVMIAYEEKLKLDFDGAFVNENPVLSWICRSSSKPGRPNARDCWVLHASAEWTTANLELTFDQAAVKIREAFETLTKVNEKPCFIQAHRWRYSIPSQMLEERFLYADNVGVCGDWCGGPRVGGAYMSGLKLAERVIETSQKAKV